jgi:hypothetical protein
MKFLVTSGCSFSDASQGTWPRYLTKALNNEFNPIYLGKLSQGNGLISRKLIHRVTELLKENSPDDLLVGIMWSGINRYDFYNDDDSLYNPTKLATKFRGKASIENPTGFVNEEKHWVIFNHFWTDLVPCDIYYKFFENSTWSQISTIEHILRTQWFLEKHNVKYFMTTYTGHVFEKDIIIHPEVEYLYKQINFDNFLPIEGELEWCKENTDIEIPWHQHPTPEQQAHFAIRVILPFLKEKQYI